MSLTALNPIVIIPARMASTRLPGKPLADIAGLPMIVQVLKRAEEANIGPVVVACAEPEIKDAVEQAGGKAVLTDPDHPSGSDRIFEALQSVDPEGKYDAIVNLQGDLPVLDADVVQAAVKPLADSGVDIATLVAEIVEEVLTLLSARQGQIDATMTLDNVVHIDHLARQEARAIINGRAE